MTYVDKGGVLERHIRWRHGKAIIGRAADIGEKEKRKGGNILAAEAPYSPNTVKWI